MMLRIYINSKRIQCIHFVVFSIRGLLAYFRRFSWHNLYRDELYDAEFIQGARDY